MMYQVINHLDEPRRYFAMTIDELCVAGLTFLLIALSTHKLMVILISGLILTALRHLKQGKAPKYLWVFAYWNLPILATGLMLSQLPPSHLRVWQV
jgi:conjugal transfer pilus assembly protein TraL